MSLVEPRGGSSDFWEVTGFLKLLKVCRRDGEEEEFLVFFITFYIAVEKPGFPKHLGLTGLAGAAEGEPPCLVHGGHGGETQGASVQSSDFGEGGSSDPVNTSEHGWC